MTVLAPAREPGLGKKPYRAREHSSFDVMTDLHQVPSCVRVRHALDVLLDDRALVEVAGDEVGRRTDQLHAACVGLVVGPAPLNPGRKE